MVSSPLEFPKIVRCKHCNEIVYGCTCCQDLGKGVVRYGTFIDGWRFGHDCIGGEHDPDFW